MASAMGRLALTDAHAALAWLSELDGPLRQRQAAASIARALGGDARALQRVIDALPASLSASSVRSELYAQLGAVSPDLALEMALSEPDRADLITALTHLADSWGVRTPREALARMGRISDPELARRFQTAVLEAWARANPLGALETISGLYANCEGDNCPTMDLEDAVRAATREDPRAAYEYARSKDLGRSDQSSISMRVQVLAAWVERDAAAALAALDAEDDMAIDVREVGQILQLAARDAPEEALAWASSQPNSQHRDMALALVAQGMRDLDRAIETAGMTSSARVRGFALSALASNTDNPAYCADRILTMPDVPQRRVLTRMLTKWTSTDSAAALDWWSAHTDAIDYKDFEHVAAMLYAADADGTMAVISALPSEASASVLNAMLSTLVHTDTAAAIDALNRTEGIEGHADNVAFVASNIARTDPEAAIRLAESRGMLAGDSDVGAGIAYGWGMRDSEAAMAWAESLNSAAARSKATQAALTTWAQQNPSGAAAWARAQPAGPARDRSLATIYMLQAILRNPASTWLEEIEDSDYRARVEAEVSRFTIDNTGGTIMSTLLKSYP